MERLFDKLARLPLSRSGDRAPRFPFKARVEVCRLNANHGSHFMGVNISRTGILVHCESELLERWPAGSIVTIVVEPDNRYFVEPVRCKAEIKRAFKDDALGLCLGLKFIVD